MTDLPKTSRPASRALASVGIESLEDLAAWPERDVADLHGMGPKAIGILRQSLTDNGLAFAAAGEEELLPAAMVERMVNGESPVRVWRDHRGLSASALAEKAGIAQRYLSQIETRKRDGTVATYRKIAAVLGVSVDDLI